VAPLSGDGHVTLPTPWSTIPLGECRHPVRAFTCRVCDLLDRTDGEGVLRYAPATEWIGHEREANAYEVEISTAELNAALPPGTALLFTDILRRMNIECRLVETRAAVVVTVVAGGDAELLVGAVLEQRRRRPRAGGYEAALADIGWTRSDVDEALAETLPEEPTWWLECELEDVMEKAKIARWPHDEGLVVMNAIVSPPDNPRFPL
jgi:hypothetical protein